MCSYKSFKQAFKFSNKIKIFNNNLIYIMINKYFYSNILKYQITTKKYTIKKFSNFEFKNSILIKLLRNMIKFKIDMLKISKI